MGVIVPEISGDNAGHDISDGSTSKLVAFEILSVFLQLLSIVFNGAIICTLCRRSLLKYPSNRFVFSLCLSHLIISVLSVSISLVTTFIPYSHQSVFYNGEHQVFPSNTMATGETTQYAPQAKESGKASVPVQCTGIHSGVDLAHLIMIHINFGVAVCTSITVALISAERYITIARPMRYKSIVTARRSLYAIICCWLLAALITMMPLLLFENRNPVCGTFSVPMESLATYFGVVFAVVTVFALAVMIVCYAHIFRIAKAKCQKVQIGHLTASTVSSISSDWPSSVYSSAQGQHRFLHAGSRIESSNSLLHWVLMSNLGRHTQPLRVPNSHRIGAPLTPPATPTLPPKTAFLSESALNSRRESDESATAVASGGIRNASSNACGGNTSSNYFIDPSRSPLFQYHHIPPRRLRNRWKTYLQPNYNSPRKTILTIMILIGAVLFTQLPLSFVLFTYTVETTQRWFQFSISVLFSTSSVANPVLYGFLNRSIRDQLWRLLRRKSSIDHGPSASSMRKRKRQHHQLQLEEMAQTSKGFLSTANHCHLQNLCRSGTHLEIPVIKISRKDSISSEDTSIAVNAASSNSIDIVGRPDATRSIEGGPKGKLIQVQRRLSSSPYYRSVLLKKASFNAKSKSLLPRLALPDVNVRRNSSGSIISIRTNGIRSMDNESDADEKCPLDKHENDLGHSQSGGDIEMQTFRNYSTPDLPSTSTEIHVGVESNETDESIVQVLNTGENDENAVEECKKESLDECIVINETEPEESSAAACIQPMDELEPGPSQNNVVNSSYGRNGDESLSMDNIMGVLFDEELLPENFPRKPSQDSGADMTFSDEEDEAPAGFANQNHLPSPQPVLLSAASLPSLPAKLAVMFNTGGKETNNKYLAKSAASLMSPLLFVEQPDQKTETSTGSQSVLYLPCSCTTDSSDVIKEDQLLDEFTSEASNNVSVTITESLNDFKESDNGWSNDDRLLQVESVHYHRQLSPCLQKGGHHKSKSESDICTINETSQNNRSQMDTDSKARTNCHIDYLVLGDKIYSNSSLPDCKTGSYANLTSLTALHSQRYHGSTKSLRDGSVWLSNGELPRLASEECQKSEGSISQWQFLNIPQSPQWLSVMSVHSSCSSLSSTCPLRILEANNKSDNSDYDDFEDHIEI